MLLEAGKLYKKVGDTYEEVTGGEYVTPALSDALALNTTTPNTIAETYIQNLTTNQLSIYNQTNAVPVEGDRKQISTGGGILFQQYKSGAWVDIAYINGAGVMDGIFFSDVSPGDIFLYTSLSDIILPYAGSTVTAAGTYLEFKYYNPFSGSSRLAMSTTASVPVNTSYPTRYAFISAAEWISKEQLSLPVTMYNIGDGTQTIVSDNTTHTVGAWSYVTIRRRDPNTSYVFEVNAQEMVGVNRNLGPLAYLFKGERELTTFTG